jgi:hypothetical protein
MSNKKYVSIFAVLASFLILVAAAPAFAQTASTTNPGNSAWQGHMRAGTGRMMKPGVFGTVASVSGDVVTVNGKQGFGTSATSTTFTVDATNATVTKNGTVGTISSIVAGDTIMAQGTLTGTNLVASTIRDGQMGMRGGPNGLGGNKSGTPPTQPISPITGNGQPVIAGSVSAINGSSLTVTNKSNVTYTVDATNAKIVQGQTTISVSGITVGDMVIVQGTVNGNSVTASSVIDQKASTTTSTTTPTHKGFFGSIGSFFSHIFGF